MSESADELSIIQSDIRPVQAPHKRGRPPKAPITPVIFEIQLPSRPSPQHAEHVYIPDYVEEPQPSAREAGAKKRGRSKGDTIANIIARRHSTSVGTHRRPGRRPKDPNIAPTSHRSNPAGAQVGKRKKGRPANVPKSARDYYLEFGSDAKFVSRPCLWEGCKAEPQNLDTLRRHIKIAHGPSGLEEANDSPSESELLSQPEPQLLVCRWGKCARSPKGKERQWTEEEWNKHIEEHHIVPYSWHMGDGVQHTNAGEEQQDELPGWLFDKNGKQVTPDARNIEVEDSATAVRRAARLSAVRQAIWDKMPVEG